MAVIFKPGVAFTRVTSAAVTEGQLLIVSGNDTVAPSSAATDAWIGIAAHDAASGDPVSVLTGGVHELGATGAIAAGASVIPATGGTVATIGAETNYARVCGVALSAAANSKVRVFVR